MKIFYDVPQKNRYYACPKRLFSALDIHREGYVEVSYPKFRAFDVTTEDLGATWMHYTTHIYPARSAAENALQHIYCVLGPAIEGWAQQPIPHPLSVGWPVVDSNEEQSMLSMRRRVRCDSGGGILAAYQGGGMLRMSLNYIESLPLHLLTLKPSPDPLEADVLESIPIHYKRAAFDIAALEHLIPDAAQGSELVREYVTYYDEGLSSESVLVYYHVPGNYKDSIYLRIVKEDDDGRAPRPRHHEVICGEFPRDAAVAACRAIEANFGIVFQNIGEVKR